MWRKEGYTGPAQPTPPTPTGDELVVFDRGQGKSLRVAIDQYEGHKYISVRLFENGWPTKTGCSLRLREIPELVEALSQVADTDSGNAGPARDRQKPQPSLKGTVRQESPCRNGDHVQNVPGNQSVATPPQEDDRPRYVDRRRRTEVVPPGRRDTFPTPRSATKPFSEFEEP